MKANRWFIGLFIFGFVLSANCNTSRKHKETAKAKPEVAQMKNTPAADSSRFSVQVTGPENEVTINNKKQTSTTKNITAPNTIRVNGTGNKVTVNKEEQTGKVNATQAGSNNRINITQSAK